MIPPGVPGGGEGCAGPAGEPSAFRVLHVCVGNVCRSVLAERLMRHALRAPGSAGAVDEMRITSAGTRAVPGLAMDPHIARILRSRGAPTNGFTTRRLTEEHIADADLVLTATRAERDHVVAMLPEALRRTFTLKEFARLAPYAAQVNRRRPSVAATPPGVVAAALAVRGHTGYVDPAADDIPDPAVNLKRLAASAEHIWLALQAIVKALRATPPPGERGQP